MHRRYISAGLALLLGAPCVSAQAAAQDELTAMRRQLDELKRGYDDMRKDYEARIRKLEHRLAASESGARERTASAPPVTAPAPVSAAASSAFNPALSLILDGKYGKFSRDPETYAIPGFALVADTTPGQRGLALGESELVMSANIDDKFYGQVTAALAPEGGVEVEEAYVQTLGLPAGLTARAGRFFSGVGYANAQHPHAWDFVDAALPYRALLGGQFGDDGAQLKWVLPTDLFVELGAELFRGDGFPAGGAAHAGTGARSLFAHVGGDVGASNSWRAGLARLSTRARERETGATPDMFSGESDVTIADVVWKWAPNGNPAQTNFKLQGEYFRRDESGAFNAAPYAGRQRGWYVQGVYQFMPRWRVGLRYDQVKAGDVDPVFVGTVLDGAGHTPKRTSAMLDYSNSEYSRFRLQYNRDESQPEVDHQWYVQYIMSLGAHGAHQY